MLLLSAATAGGVAGLISGGPRPASAVSSTRPAQVFGCRAIDGDTLRCGWERIRLIGIDAPEIGDCPQWRRCAPGNGEVSKEQLAAALEPSLRIDRFGTDRYGRTLALVAGRDGDLSCRQVLAGAAQYRADWDTAGLWMRCPVR